MSSLADADIVNTHLIPLTNVGHKYLPNFQLSADFEEFVMQLKLEIKECRHSSKFQYVPGEYQFFLYHAVSPKKKGKKILSPANVWSHGDVPDKWRECLLQKQHLLVVSPNCKESELGINFSRGEADKLSSLIKTEPQVDDSAEITDLTVDEFANEEYEAS